MGDRELADLPVNVTLSQPELLAKGYRDYQRYSADAARVADGVPVAQTRDVLRAGKVVAVLPIDLARDEIVLIRQFRLPAHLANGRGDLIETVAGRVEPGESLIDAARRECQRGDRRRADRAGRAVQLSDNAGDNRRGGHVIPGRCRCLADPGTFRRSSRRRAYSAPCGLPSTHALAALRRARCATARSSSPCNGWRSIAAALPNCCAPR